MSNTIELAAERIEGYHRIRKGFNLTGNPERSHTWSLQLLNILRGSPVIGEIGMKQIREWCHFPDLESEIEVGNFHLGELTMNYPVGTAAGMFKRADRVPWELFQEGGMQVGFVTVGCSLYGQPGNAKPRHFSFPNKDGIGGAGINRYGLNNPGARPTADSLALARKQQRIPPGLLIVANIFNGASTLEQDKSAELIRITQLIINHVDAIEVNISCPNQKGGRDWEKKIEFLIRALRWIKEAADGKPIFLKISPDTDEETLRAIIEASKDFVTGYSSTNTTTDSEIREKILRKEWYGDLIGTDLKTLDPKKEHGKITLLSGGISGDLLLPRQIAMTWLIRVLAPKHAIIGIGGIGDKESAARTVTVGANALAMYSRWALDGQWAFALAHLWAARALKVMKQ